MSWVKHATDGDEYFNPNALAEAQSQNDKSRDRLIYMSPDVFLSMTAPLGTPHPSKSQRIDQAIKQGTKFEQLPYLKFEREGARAIIKAHEGRHRALALQALGVKELPVVLEGDIRWGNQNDKYDRIEEWPTVLVGQSGNEIPFPVSDLRATQ
jgi:hypothetical protein